MAQFTVERTQISAEWLQRLMKLPKQAARARVVERSHRQLPDGQVVMPGDVIRKEHDGGRVSGAVMARTVTVKCEDLGLHPNDVRWMCYRRGRELGMSHDEAVARLFPEGKVTV